METIGPRALPKTFVLCFDGTGNKFSGDESDSNVLKIFRMLDRSRGHQFHYYQPGIGTYVTSTSLSSTSTFSRIKSAYLKAKDSAVGSSFDQHVMGGYKFLMRYYNHGDDIYFFGFSRGAYIARFLAEMLDYIGLLEAGNEELIRFAWKTFAKWQRRPGDTEGDLEEKKRLFKYMKAFRETFSRPISQIKFMGLFDTVNSVPKFESAWMQRSKFPYTARSSAKVIRHAVGIDERRAKFRQDLISEIGPAHHHHLHCGSGKAGTIPKILVNEPTSKDESKEGDRSAEVDFSSDEGRYRPPSTQPWNRNLSLAVPGRTASMEDSVSRMSQASVQVPSIVAAIENHEREQDIQEAWFPGGHADIGGGWKLEKGEDWPLSHAPLVWIVQEAQSAGLDFDEKKLKQFECCEEYAGNFSPIRERVQVDMWSPFQNPAAGSHSDGQNGQYNKGFGGDFPGSQKGQSASSCNFNGALHYSSTQGILHDCLQYGEGLRWPSVLSWRVMEYLPFRRMDLQQDGSWKPIRWPLPCGEVRDIPDEAQIHVSAIRRMKYNPNYRPGNLIIGGGGRGVRRAPKEYDSKKWEVHHHEGDSVRETYMRKTAE
ncbi:hypothetical protein Egran_05516 [Elaphomyces granulatus]|uniref:T6SS Phospholipase effector Tle1-like catalytic domain-containing protein n=1 Tax=Elaphomyces granulatus TaxID=519963 RepID=A0A232LRE6_9EURO|nr:hypothetical protein Egran_05516 [Elaphomyces granulatus]